MQDNTGRRYAATTSKMWEGNQFTNSQHANTTTANNDCIRPWCY